VGVVLEQHPPDAAGRARAATAVRHPHVVPILDLVEDAETLWVVRERIPARSLAEIVGEHGPMPVAAATLIGAQVASALAVAHAAGVTHGALTLDAILVADVSTAPFAMVGGLGSSPPTDAGTDVHALGEALSAAVGGQASEPLSLVLWKLTADDPAQRPSAEQAHVELARLAGAAGPAPRARLPRRRLLALGAVSVAAVLVLALTVGLAVRAAPVPVPAVPPIAAADERALDPCSLIDVAALAPIGRATIVPGYGVFSECVAIIPMGVDDLHVEIELRNRDTAGHDATPRDPLHPVAVPGHQGNGNCSRDVLLPDGHVVSVAAVIYGYAQRDFCAVADIAAESVIARLLGSGLTARTSDADRSALDGLNACDLLDQESVTAAVTAAGGAPASGPKSGYAGWYCDWAPVWIDFMRESAPGAPDFYGERVTIGGRSGLTRTEDDTSCRAYVPQRFFMAEDHAMRAEYVRVIVDGTRGAAAICSAAVELADRVAARLPAFG
jgi:hypothetical protein